MLFSCERVPDLRLSLNESLHMVHREDWNTVARSAGPYLQYDHLLALEDRMGGGMEFRYVIYYSKEMCIRDSSCAVLIRRTSVATSSGFPPRRLAAWMTAHRWTMRWLNSRHHPRMPCCSA